MNIFKYFKILFICMFSFVIYGNATADINYRLIQYLPFDGNASDASGNNLQTEIAGNLIFSEGIVGTGSAYFDGQTRLRTLYAPIMVGQKKNFTFCTWIKTVDTNFQPVIDFGDTGWKVMISPESLVFYGSRYGYSRVPLNGINYRNGRFTKDWHHFCVSASSSSKSSETVTYFDGQIESSRTIEREVVSLTVRPSGYIGKEMSGTNRDSYFRGFLDEVRIYDRILSESEIRQLFEQKVESGCVSSVSNDTIQCKPELLSETEASRKLENCVIFNSTNLNATFPCANYNNKTYQADLIFNANILNTIGKYTWNLVSVNEIASRQTSYNYCANVSDNLNISISCGIYSDNRYLTQLKYNSNTSYWELGDLYDSSISAMIVTNPNSFVSAVIIDKDEGIVLFQKQLEGELLLDSGVVFYKNGTEKNISFSNINPRSLSSILNYGKCVIGEIKIPDSKEEAIGLWDGVVSCIQGGLDDEAEDSKSSLFRSLAQKLKGLLEDTKHNKFNENGRVFFTEEVLSPSHNETISDYARKTFNHLRTLTYKYGPTDINTETIGFTSEDYIFAEENIEIFNDIGEEVKLDSETPVNINPIPLPSGKSLLCTKSFREDSILARIEDMCASTENECTSAGGTVLVQHPTPESCNKSCKNNGGIVALASADSDGSNAKYFETACVNGLSQGSFSPLTSEEACHKGASDACVNQPTIDTASCEITGDTSEPISCTINNNLPHIPTEQCFTQAWNDEFVWIKTCITNRKLDYRITYSRDLSDTIIRRKNYLVCEEGCEIPCLYSYDCNLERDSISFSPSSSDINVKMKVYSWEYGNKSPHKLFHYGHTSYPSGSYEVYTEKRHFSYSADDGRTNGISNYFKYPSGRSKLNIECDLDDGTHSIVSYSEDGQVANTKYGIPGCSGSDVVVPNPPEI